jgi:hypothetical protein
MTTGKIIWIVLILMAIAFLYDVMSTMRYSRDVGVNSAVEEYVKKNIDYSWFSSSESATDIKVDLVKVKRSKPEDKGKKIIESDVVITGSYVPDSGDNKGETVKFKITRKFRINKESWGNEKVELLD